jgi:hypothetical protein
MTPTPKYQCPYLSNVAEPVYCQRAQQCCPNCCFNLAMRTNEITKQRLAAANKLR